MYKNKNKKNYINLIQYNFLLAWFGGTLSNVSNIPVGMTNEIVPLIVVGSQAIMNCGILDRLLKQMNYPDVDYSWRFQFTSPSPSVTESIPQCALNPTPHKNKKISIAMNYNCIDMQWKHGMI